MARCERVEEGRWSKSHRTWLSIRAARLPMYLPAGALTYPSRAWPMVESLQAVIRWMIRVK